MIRFLLLTFIGILFPHFSLPGAQPAPPKPSPGRYLFLVETSSEMRMRAANARKAVNSLLLSGMSTELRADDTIGVWTYNERLHAGNLPLQDWTPQTEQTVASNIVTFLKDQRLEKQARFEAVLPELQPLVKESEKLTIFLICTGSENISGTPYDREINEFFKANSWKQKQKRLPFIVVLRSFRGAFAGFTLNLPPWPVTFPPFPPPPKVAAAPKPKPVEKTAAPAAPPPTAPPLVVIGQKPEPVTEPAPAPSEPTSQNPPTPPASESTATAAPAAATPKAELANTANIAKPPSMPAVDPKPAQNASAPAVATSQPQRVPTADHVLTVAAKPNASQGSTAAPASQSNSSEEQQNVTSPAQVAASTQPENVFTPKALVIISLVLLILVIALVLVMQRRVRNAASASLITRSMDRDHK